MIESIMITWCLNNGMHYVDYYVTSGGRICFVATKGKKTKTFYVRKWNPLICVEAEKLYRNSRI